LGADCSALQNETAAESPRQPFWFRGQKALKRPDDASDIRARDRDGSEVMIDPRFPDVGDPTFHDVRSLDEEFVIVRAWRLYQREHKAVIGRQKPVVLVLGFRAS
jgi:hypothetical protein